VDAHHLLLRSERSGKGSGRTYTITVTCTDPAGHTVVRTTTVVVPKSQARTSTGLDSPSTPATTTAAAPNAAAPTSAIPGNRGAVVYVPFSNGVQNKTSRRSTSSTRKKKRVLKISTR
jgi:hypothetical protein